MKMCFFFLKVLNLSLEKISSLYNNRKFFKLPFTHIQIQQLPSPGQCCLNETLTHISLRRPLLDYFEANSKDLIISLLNTVVHISKR